MRFRLVSIGDNKKEAFICCRLDYCTSLLDAVYRTLYCASCSLCRTPLHDWSLARDAVITSRRYYANCTGCPSESVSSSKWNAWLASRCLGRRLSTWQTTAASCPTALGALCGQLTCVVPRTLSSYGDRTFVAAGPHLWNCAIQTSPMDCSDDSWRDIFSGSMNTALCDFWYAGAIEKRLLTYWSHIVVSSVSDCNSLYTV